MGMSKSSEEEHRHLTMMSLWYLIVHITNQKRSFRSTSRWNYHSIIWYGIDTAEISALRSQRPYANSYACVVYATGTLPPMSARAHNAFPWQLMTS
jgi:hypothetical protein